MSKPISATEFVFAVVKHYGNTTELKTFYQNASYLYDGYSYCAPYLNALQDYLYPGQRNSLGENHA